MKDTINDSSCINELKELANKLIEKDSNDKKTIVNIINIIDNKSLSSDDKIAKIKNILNNGKRK